MSDEMGEVFTLVTDPVRNDHKILELAEVGFCIPCIGGSCGGVTDGGAGGWVGVTSRV